MLSLRATKKVVVIAGCLGMAYTQLTLSPAVIEFCRVLGAGGLEFGILGALPIGLLFLQLAAGVVVNHLRYRKPLWFGLSVLQRLILVPVALGPLLLPGVSDALWVWLLIVLTAANHGLLHFCTPLWLSWMGDYLPHAGLNRFWGKRHRWMQWAAAASLLLSACVLFQWRLDIRLGFAVLNGVGALCGVLDILLFWRVEEPAVRPMPNPKLTEVFRQPFADRGFRSFIAFSCFWHAAAMVGAPFISLFLLDFVGMDLYHVLLLWTFSWAGGAVLSDRLGSLAERHGHRPVLILCTAFKPMNMVALLLVPRDPQIAFWVLVPVFMIDALLNAGIAIANNGFLLKNSPTENRTMFIAAGLAYAGLAGGIASVLAGIALAAMGDLWFTWGGYEMVGFHVLFAISLLLRLASAIQAVSLHEPTSEGTWTVLTELIGATPVRILRFPVVLYRSWREGDEPDDDG